MGPAETPRTATPIPGPLTLIAEYDHLAELLADLDAELFYSGAEIPDRLRSAYVNVTITLERRLMILAAEYFYQTGGEITGERAGTWTAALTPSA